MGEAGGLEGSGILIQVGSTTVATRASDHLSGITPAESVMELCGMT